MRHYGFCLTNTMFFTFPIALLLMKIEKESSKFSLQEYIRFCLAFLFSILIWINVKIGINTD